MMTQVIQPTSQQELQQRNQLIQQYMRPPNIPFTVEQEYPIVLSPQDPQFSHCIKINDQIVAHANLWPRELIMTNHNQRAWIGLIGNVVTHPKYRGQGLMKKLMEHLKTIAIQKDISLLILWSDLISLYQKLGFQSLGVERRYHIRRVPIKSAPKTFHNLESAHQLTDRQIMQLMKHRLELPVLLQRSPTEFRQLLTIPETHIIVDQDFHNYLIWGKGYDMIGVIHEWAANSAEKLMEGIHFIFKHSAMDTVILLTPYQLPLSWHRILRKYALRYTTHPMALACFLKDDPLLKLEVQNLFIWGLDSI